ncbi:MAG: DUF1292 domain-containing protein [Cellulosilyticaceae bacterium]
MEESIMFFDENTGEEVEFEIVDRLTVEEITYILVVDADDEATILKQIEDDENSVRFELIEDENEFRRITLLFMESDEYDIEV